MSEIGFILSKFTYQLHHKDRKNGTGSYHRNDSFTTFSHFKSIVKKANLDRFTYTK